MLKNVLILCTGNSCRSIIAEALINKELGWWINAHSAGVRASGVVNENAKKILKFQEAWSDNYYSKTLDEILHLRFDLVVTVCDNAKANCPIFPQKTEVLHIGFTDPDGKEFEEFRNTYADIRDILLPIVEEKLIL